MTSLGIPFVDLSLQHEPIQEQLEQAVRTILHQGNFVLGQELMDFEQAFAEACGVGYAIGVASGTDAIALGLQACGIGEGDEVLVPTNTFIATVIGVLKAKARPVLVDCVLETALLDLEAAAKAVTAKTKAVIPVHLYGQMVAPGALLDFARRHNLIIFEDSAQAHLAQREGYRAGSMGLASAFSFYPSKNLGAMGDGGAVVTHDGAIAQTLRSYRNYGASQKYVHVNPGTNSRLDTLQAAVLGVKLPHLEAWNRSRNAAARGYDLALEPLRDRGIIPIANSSGSGHVYHLYVVRVSEACPLTRETLQEKLAAAGIQTGIHYPIPCHLQPAYAGLGYQAGDFPKAEILAREILSLPMYPGLSEIQVKTVADTLDEILN